VHPWSQTGQFDDFLQKLVGHGAQKNLCVFFSDVDLDASLHAGPTCQWRKHKSKLYGTVVGIRTERPALQLSTA
jgi:hypothetical protein